MRKAYIWSKENLFYGPFSTFLSLFLLVLLGIIFSKLLGWLVWDAVFTNDPQICRQSSGFCYPFIFEKFTYILFGPFPRELIWRPIIGLFSVFLFLSLLYFPFFYRTKVIVTTYLMSLIILLWFLSGGLGLSEVPSSKWGGLPLTMFLALVANGPGFVLGIILALGRNSSQFVIKKICIGIIELVRGVPLISLLFMSSVMLPLFFPEGISVNKLLRASCALILFVGAYMAEVIRGGLQSIDKGQWEASKALGLSHVQILRFIILPQALRVVVVPLMNTAIGMFKDTSLVIIIALFDLMFTVKSSLTDMDWLGFGPEAYLFCALIYFIFCKYLTIVAKKIEKHMQWGK